MRTAAYQRQTNERVHVFDASAMRWEETARPGLRLKSIRIDDERREFLGQIAFDPYVRSGLHIDSPFGALALVRAEGRERRPGAVAAGELFGF